MRGTFLALGALTAGLAGMAGLTVVNAQSSLDSRINARADGLVGITYASRDDVCGYGGTSIRIGSGTFIGEGSWISHNGEWESNQPCERGPVRVLLTRAEGRTVGLKVAVGGAGWPAGTTELGAVSATQAASYFLAQAAALDGRLGREALLPAVLADSSETWRGLLGIARNRQLSRGLRESATSWLGREAAGAGAGAREIATALNQLAGDREEPASLRTRAVQALARNDGQGTASLIALSDASDPVVSRAALQALGRSADPRARDALRRKVRDGSIPESLRDEAIKALGGRDAVPSDYAMLRELYPRLTDAPSRNAVVEALAEAGGSDNLAWLMNQAKDANASASDRSRAVRGAVRAGATTADLIRLYDGGQDRRVKEALVEALARIGDRAAFDKLLSIARTETDPQIRRSAISRLSKSGDARVTEMLKDIVEK
jgi:HEAT repeat protein